MTRKPFSEAVRADQYQLLCLLLQALTEAEAYAVVLALVERSLRRTVPSSRGHTWSTTPRTFPGVAAKRDPGLDRFYSPGNGTIAWNLITGLHDPPVRARRDGGQSEPRRS